MKHAAPTPPAVFQRLVEELSGLNADGIDEFQDFDAHCIGKFIVAELLATPFISPLDDYTYELLLGFSGLNLDQGADLAVASAITEYLLGTGHFHLLCSHDGSASPLCLRVKSGIDSLYRELGQLETACGDNDRALAMKIVREKRHENEQEQTDENGD